MCNAWEERCTGFGYLTGKETKVARSSIYDSIYNKTKRCKLFWGGGADDANDKRTLHNHIICNQGNIQRAYVCI